MGDGEKRERGSERETRQFWEQSLFFCSPPHHFPFHAQSLALSLIPDNILLLPAPCSSSSDLPRPSRHPTLASDPQTCGPAFSGPVPLALPPKSLLYPTRLCEA